ncbi:MULTISPECIES: 5-carboxymethyl-2-hydroxymuconate Delta-isomerase [unclassified Pseudoalteromonas]|uniref:5-carboxymethyl-2-hydroxymuconate Delta-isomerase n=1 Tax=unclassified Pseudoalteromonas TaxID=194690 RepID=UPI000B3CD0F8|nr:MULTISPECIES: 5-carboxymethyl-2-hydroxymuconate Delta-isomerase [unclassified Pseudoalteromonas]MDN3380093.1 5-carboxymethyl-2-hydroxymuconate Delta-isomerase [Pseudoalteromonas sp. APC 3893]MDN3386666.1 5-carboxymethyl-2-hydroxymuconate Delta-isomerase [Pseudoalteromonas sp. APC 4017]OUS70879.1 5-carboxymethyl-2-hydroxymuconate isomerase [Pseudoalteromonas sp. A601]
MPHVVIEHSEDLPLLPQVLVDKVHQTTFESGLFELSTIKTRAIAYQHYQLGEGKDGFIYIAAYIMAGRTTTEKQDLSERLLNCLRTYCRKSYSLSVNIYENNSDTYRKC